jgi:hypothetical protein
MNGSAKFLATMFSGAIGLVLGLSLAQLKTHPEVIFYLPEVACQDEHLLMLKTSINGIDAKETVVVYSRFDKTVPSGYCKVYSR